MVLASVPFGVPSYKQQKPTLVNWSRRALLESNGGAWGIVREDRESETGKNKGTRQTRTRSHPTPWAATTFGTKAAQEQTLQDPRSSDFLPPGRHKCLMCWDWGLSSGCLGPGPGSQSLLLSLVRRASPLAQPSTATGFSDRPWGGVPLRGCTNADPKGNRGCRSTRSREEDDQDPRGFLTRLLVWCQLGHSKG